MSDARTPRVSIGFASETGRRTRNEDFGGAIGDPPAGREAAAAVADGIGSAKGGRIAAETAVRFFLDGLWDVPETMDIRRTGARIIDSLNAWLHAQGRQDPLLAGMGCTFTALVLRGRHAHVLHAGDTRAYRLSGDRLTRLTVDHIRQGDVRLLTRALGIEAEVRLDYTTQPMALHDRFLLCTDGVHGVLLDEELADILRTRSGPAETARALVATALEAGSTDNATALVLDVTGLPTARPDEIGGVLHALPLIPTPHAGEIVDGFALDALISDGPTSRLFAAADRIDGGVVALKFPKPAVSETASRHAAFVREAAVGHQVTHPGLVRTIELPPGRQSALYTVMPFTEGELLERRLARPPALTLEEGRNIGVRLARAADALHRAGIIHRDIKPANVILEPAGTLKLLDFGAVRLPGLEDEPEAQIPGTPAYVAPEMFDGEPGRACTDVYAIGVTLFRALTGEFPYGNQDAITRSRLERALDLTSRRPDLPAWLQAVLARAVALDPAERYPDAATLAADLEAGPAHAMPTPSRPLTLYERAPVRIWQAISLLLAMGLIGSLLR